MKTYDKIVEWGKLKAFTNDKLKEMIGLDLETIDNKLFILGTYHDKYKYKYTLNNFIDFLFDTIIYATQNNLHIATWTRYDNTQLTRLLLEQLEEDERNEVIEKIGKVSANWNRKEHVYLEEPLMSFKYKDFTINVDNIIRNSILFRVFDNNNNTKSLWSFDIRNLYVGFNLERASRDNGFNWYSKISEDAHIIDAKRFYSNNEYKTKVLKSNELDAKVVKFLGEKIQEDFKEIFNVYPNNLVSAGSLARSSVIAFSKLKGTSTGKINVASILDLKKSVHERSLDYSMQAYHGGKIDSYVLGFTGDANMVDISSAYPAILKDLKGFNESNIYYAIGRPRTSQYNYLFVKCNLTIKESSDTFSTPFIIKNPLENHSNLNPYGYLKGIVLTKFEYQFVLKNLDKIDIEYIDHIYITGDKKEMIYKDIILDMFDLRLKYKKEGKISLDNLVKTIINSLYGITYELNDKYNEDLEKIGFRAGDYFNPIIASHITGGTRVKLTEMNNHILKRGGEILLNMTDSILYKNADIKDLCFKDKILGEFEMPDNITETLILGSGRYEYKDDKGFVFRTRGFTAKTSDKSYYKEVLRNKGIIENKGFVTLAKSRTKDFTYKDIGLIYDNEYELNPFNLGGKRTVDLKDYEIDLTKDYIKTKQVYLDKYLWKIGDKENE